MQEATRAYLINHLCRHIKKITSDKISALEQHVEAFSYEEHLCWNPLQNLLQIIEETFNAFYQLRNKTNQPLAAHEEF